MIQLGYALSSEEHGPAELVRLAQQAEEAGFEFALISDHYHPWVDTQGQSPFVWSVIGGIAQVTRDLRLGTGVTCPLIRIHPAIIAQAAATAASMMPGRFFLGLGAGENLNEHVLGDKWPEAAIRHEMLEEAIDVIRELWRGDVCSHHGRHYTVEEAKLYTLPEELPPIYVAADAAESAELAGSCGDGMIAVAPDGELVETLHAAARGERPCYGQVTVCWAASEKRGVQVAREFWPTSGLKGHLSWEVKTPALFEQAVKTVRDEDIAESIVCGPRPEPYLEKVHEFAEAGFDHVYFHQVGPDQKGFFEFFTDTLAPALRGNGRQRSGGRRQRR